MFRVDKITNRISLTKGDNAEMLVKLFDVTGKERPIFDDDIITFSVRKYAAADLALAIKADKGYIRFVPKDTKDLAAGTYVYDIELKTFGGNIYTVVPLSYFDLLDEVSK